MRPRAKRAQALYGLWFGSSVAVECEAVDNEGVAEEVEALAGVSDAVGAADPEGVFDVAVDRFRVIPAGIAPREVRIERCVWHGRFRHPHDAPTYRVRRCLRMNSRISTCLAESWIIRLTSSGSSADL